MPPPSFEEVGLKVKDFVEDVFWCKSNVKLNFKSRKDPTLLFSLISYPPDHSTDPFYPYSDSHRPVLRFRLTTLLYKKVLLSFAHHQFTSFSSSLTFPLFSDSFQQEISGALSKYEDRKSCTAPFENPEFLSKSSFKSENVAANFVTDVRGRKIKSHLSVVLSKNNFVVGPRLGISLKKPSRQYLDLKLAYERENVEAFSYFSFKQFRSLRQWHFGIVHKSPRIDVGLYSVVKEKMSSSRRSTLTICYRPNSWSSLKFSLTNNLMLAFNYDFTVTEGFVAALGFSTDLSHYGPCGMFNVSFGMDL